MTIVPNQFGDIRPFTKRKEVEKEKGERGIDVLEERRCCRQNLPRVLQRERSYTVLIFT